ncbi:MAG: hypothetical protein JF887_12240 [Candidatus Dormibacteraeota bacterium]|uniref:Uncharacterized protein n=1 Tax=Candidatus Amunia macphersoniae TaxID=3127014 RepID=A0A934KM37_9BACT|nr:hypothetical protein [Candidatus Dormibacteraeota bacterium]
MIAAGESGVVGTMAVELRNPNTFPFWLLVVTAYCVFVLAFAWVAALIKEIKRETPRATLLVLAVLPPVGLLLWAIQLDARLGWRSVVTIAFGATLLAGVFAMWAGGAMSAA